MPGDAALLSLRGGTPALSASFASEADGAARNGGRRFSSPSSSLAPRSLLSACSCRRRAPPRRGTSST
eukprot:883312-Pyramimonas_sp.AAC.1